MHPTLFHIFNFPIHSYGFMLALSFLFGIWLSSHRARNKGLDPNVVTDVGFYVILAAIIGARLYYVLLHFEEFQGNILNIFNPVQNGCQNLGIGGLVMYGGFIGAIIAGILYFNIKKQPFLPYADAIAPSLGFGIFLTRIGCFLNGCCYGAPVDSAIGVEFPPGSPAGAYQREIAQKMSLELGHSVEHVTLWPSQLFLSAGGLTIGIIILLVGSKKIFTGFQFYLTGILYSILRFAVDFTRYYAPDEKVGILSHNQIVCIALFLIFTGLILKNTLFQEQAPGPVPAEKEPANSSPEQQSENIPETENSGQSKSGKETD
ncbi:MAG: prolipoprotein diacylglyceryl transferase [Chitinivibrionales bacterium]|nr:prolipoprotein diacylglyceryl transferase [Chitinivibrionales bacterium]